MKNMKKLLFIAISFLLLITVSFSLTNKTINVNGAENIENRCVNYVNGGYASLEIQQKLEEQPFQYARTYKEKGAVETAEISISNDLLDLRQSGMQLFSTSVPYEVTTILNSGLEDKDSIVIVFMGAGYTSTEQGNWPNPAEGTFLYQAKAVTETMMKTHPFKEFSHLFTVYAVQAISAQTNIPFTDRGETYNPFGVYFAAADDIVATENGQTVARNLAKSVSADVKMMQIIANRNSHGGKAYWNPYSTYLSVTLAVTATQIFSSGSPWTPAWHGTVIHEFGHSFGQLADEYNGVANSYSTDMEYAERRANLTRISNTSTVKWSHWINYEGITTRSIGAGWYVPSAYEACTMYASWANDTFCAVCSAELTRRMAYISKDTFYGRSPFPYIEPTPTNKLNFSVGIKEPNTPYVTISSDETRILPYAFHGNVSLESITISNNVKTIGRYAFIGATKLAIITNQATVPQQIDSTTFAGLKRSDITVIIPNGTTQAYIKAGWTGFSLFETNIPFITSVSGGNATITGVKNGVVLSGSVKIPSKVLIEGKVYPVTAIGTSAFANQSICTEIIIPDSVKNIGECAFYNCTSLINIKLPSGITNIDYETFKNCSSLSSIKIPSSVTKIGNNAFTNCSNLTNIAFEPNSQLTKIDMYAFTSAGLNTITIPNKVNVDLTPFVFCNNTTIYYEGTSIPEGGDKEIIPWNVSKVIYGYPIFIQYEYHPVIFGCNLSTDKTYIVSFAKNANSISNRSNYSINAPYRENYTFGGWYDSPSYTGTGYSAAQISGAPNGKTYYAKWIPNKYTITYRDIGNINFSGTHGANPPTTHTYGTDTNLVNPTKANYSFGGWFINSDGTETPLTKLSSTGYTSDITLYAKWIPKTYNIIYRDVGDINFSGTHGAGYPTSHTYGTITNLINPTKAGITFLGWFTNKDGNGTPVTSLSATGYTSDVTLYAKWTSIYTIAYYDVNGSLFSGTHGAGYPTKHTYGTDTVLVNPTRTGYTFGGWFINSAGTGTPLTKLLATGYSANINLYAKWIPNSYTITYRDIDNIAFSGIHGMTYPTVHTQGTTTYLDNPTKTGYAFGGWYLNSNGTGTPLTYLSATGYTSDITLYAKWNPIYTINYRDVGDVDFSGTHEIGCPIMHTYGTTTYLDNPTKTGYAFGGWFTNSDGTGARLTSLNATEVNSNITLYAKWTSYFKYKLIDNDTAYEVSIMDGVMLAGNIVIPNTYNGLLVTSIANYGFCDNYAENDYARTHEITSITIPSSVTKIGNYAFCGLIGLTSLTIPSNVMSIGDSAFYNCINIIEINLNATGIKELGNNVFCFIGQNNTGITVNIGANVTEIPAYLFDNSNKIISVNFVGGSICKNIGNYAFKNCDSLTMIIIPNSVTSIGSNAFSGCNKLTIYTEWLNLPAGWNETWNSNRPVFFACELSEDNGYIVSFTKTSNSILNSSAINGISAPYRDGYAFSGWYADSSFSGAPYTVAKMILAPNGTYYAKWAEFTDGLEFTLINGNEYEVSMGTAYINGAIDIVIPAYYNGLPVTRVADYGFSILAHNLPQPNKILSVTIPFTITEIGNFAFYDCESLEYIFFEPNSELKIIGDFAFTFCVKLESIILPDNVTYIGAYSFYLCVSLTDISIPDGAYIGEYAFYHMP